MYYYGYESIYSFTQRNIYKFGIYLKAMRIIENIATLKKLKYHIRINLTKVLLSLYKFENLTD